MYVEIASGEIHVNIPNSYELYSILPPEKRPKDVYGRPITTAEDTKLPDKKQSLEAHLHDFSDKSLGFADKPVVHLGAVEETENVDGIDVIAKPEDANFMDMKNIDIRLSYKTIHQLELLGVVASTYLNTDRKIRITFASPRGI
ncbi:hypothetical protein KY336_00355 [Candidatus Woesearchaeota archaeon]|nr:hypothetical protein [Candidatus Woesearchaeota archaeon]